MNIKLLSSIIAITFGSTMGTITHAATETTEKTTIEQSKTVEVPKPAPKVKEETTTTTTKRGVLGKKKTETTSTTRYEQDQPNNTSSAEVKTKTTVKTEKSN